MNNLNLAPHLEIDLCPFLESVVSECSTFNMKVLETSNIIKSAMGCENTMPFRPNRWLRRNNKGIYNRPCREMVKIKALKGLPIAWKVVEHNVIPPINGRDRIKVRRIAVPLLRTSARGVNTATRKGDEAPNTSVKNRPIRLVDSIPVLIKLAIRL